MNETHEQANEPSGKLTEEHARQIETVIGQSQYNPYRYWLVGSPGEQTRVPVFQIKASEDLTICASPIHGLLIKGKDYLHTLQQFQYALLAELSEPMGTIVTITCTAPFDVNGQKRRQPANPEPADTDAPARPVAAAEPVEDPTPTPALAEPSIFAGVDEYVDETVATDPNDTDQLGLF